MHSTTRPLWPLLGVALLAMGTAGSVALREEARQHTGVDVIATPAPVVQVATAIIDASAGDLAPSTLATGASSDATDPVDVGGGDLSSAGPPTRKIHRVCRVTAYHDRGLTAAGVPSGLGQCAAPADIPIGSQIHIPALGRTFVVTDRTHRRFRNSTVDLFVPCPDRCRQFGRKYLEVEITLPADRPTRAALLRAAERHARSG